MRTTPTLLRLSGLVGATAALLIGAACDTNQSLVFSGAVEGVPAVLDLGQVTPIVPTGLSSLEDAVIYGEIGPTGTSETGGVTFNFEGTNSSLCVWVDPEAVFWNATVSPTNPDRVYRLPDNMYDDGDLDLDVGQSLYYTGTPGERMGSFQVRYEDSNGNVVPFELTECEGPEPLFTGAQGIGKAGRASPEYCTIRNTLEDVDYTVTMSTWSTPIDDDRLGFGMLIMEGDCQSLIDSQFGEGTGGGPALPGGGATSGLPKNQWECVIKGEIIEPNQPSGANAQAAGLPERTWLGAAEVPSWERSVAFEEAFCRRDAAGDQPGLLEFCRNERERVIANGEQCSWAFDASAEDANGVRCFCGDRNDLPDAGAF